MAFLLGDVFIGNFPVTQDFGGNPEIYSARFGLKGHNGVDFGCPTGTMILSAADGLVSETAFDAGGYGNYVKIVHSGYLTLYGHLNDYQVKVGDRVVSGQLIGHSNNTGNSTGPHLHFGVAPCDANGNKTETSNGYSGYINPMGSECEWKVENLTVPIVPSPEVSQPDIPVPAKEFPIIVAQGTNFKVTANFAIGNGLNDFLSANNYAIIDLTQNPGDPDAGNRLNIYIADLLTQIKELKDKVPSPTTPVDQIPDTVKTSLFKKIMQSIHDFIFTGGGTK